MACTQKNKGKAALAEYAGKMRVFQEVGASNFIFICIIFYARIFCCPIKKSEGLDAPICCARIYMDSFISRQPIFNVSNSIYGYELLFRNGIENAFNFGDGDKATLDVLALTLFHTPFSEFVGGKRGFVNFTRSLLLSDVALLFPKENLIVEVLENIEPDDEVLQACAKFKADGYRIAMDDFVMSDLNSPLLQLADIVKVDFLQLSAKERKAIADALLPRKIVLLAEKVETPEDCRQGIEYGYQLFQGYFFSRPILETKQRVPPNKLACLQLLQTVSKDDFDFDALDRIVRGDPSLTYRILRLVSSPYFGLRPEISSVRHALTLLGRANIRRFVSLIAVSTLADSKPPELILTCMIRAKIAEGIAAGIGWEPRSSEFFLAGLLSLMDAMIDRPMDQILTMLSVSPEIKAALLGEQNSLRAALDAIVAYERGNWDQVSRSAGSLGFKEESMPGIYASAISWATEFMHSL
jgi:EAL and modified HD-GYP domain-containing signal transduction protein